MNTDCTFCQQNLDAYGLGALPDQETSRIERHLPQCARCRTTLGSIRRVTNLLPFLAEPADPSPMAKAKLFARIERGEPEDAAREMPFALANPWTSFSSAPEPTPSPQPARGAWQRWIAPGIIAPLAICLLVISAWANSLQNEVEDLRSSEIAEAASTQAPAAPTYDMQLYEFKPACKQCEERQASGQFGGNPNGSVGVVVAWNLDPDEKHQVWCIDSRGEKTLITDLEVQYTGNVFQTVNFPQAIGGYEQIYVARHDGTREPDAELLVAMNDEHEIDSPATAPAGSSGG
jgi:hypothetical protein